MTNMHPRRSATRTLSIAIALLIVTGAGLVVALKSAWIDPALAKRGVSALIGLLLALCGNYLPKMTRTADADTAVLGRADRAAGRILVLTGLGFAVLWLLAPLDVARALASMAGLACAALAVLAWIWTARRAANGPSQLAISATDTAARLALLMLVASIFLTFGLFEIDRIWGDRAAQWSAIVYIMLLVFAGGIPAFLTLRRRG